MYNNLIIDGNNFLYRAYFAQKKYPKFHNGLNIAPIHKFLTMLKNLMEEYTPNNVYITWDKRSNPDAVNFRRTLVSSYKEQRVESDDTRQIHTYFPIIINICNTLGIKTILPYSLEGDDVIYYLCSVLEGNNLIVSSDRDLLQLVSHKTDQLLPNRGIVDINNFVEFAGCSLESYILFKAIKGDVSDNIEGLPKFGDKRACTLAEEINKSSLEEYDKLTDEQKELIRNNLKVVDISYGMKNCSDDMLHAEQQINEQRDSKFNRKEFIDLMNEYGGTSVLRQIGSWQQLFSKITNDQDCENWIDNLSL